MEEEKALDEIKSSISKSTGISSDELLFNAIGFAKTKKNNNSSANTSIRDIKLPQMENLSIIFTIFKNMLLLSDKELIEQLLSNDLHLITFGALDHDFEIQKPMKTIKHRDYYEGNVKFRNILNISNEDILNIIHLNYRLNYLRDTVITGFMTDNLKSILTMMIASNNRCIVIFFLSNKEYLYQLINQLKIKRSYFKWDLIIAKNACKFIIELLHCSKDSIDLNKINQVLCEYGLLNQIENLLSHPIRTEFKGLLAEIIFDIYNEQPQLIQDQIIHHLSNKFLSILFEYVFTQNNINLKYELSSMINSLFSIITSKQIIEQFLNNCLNDILNYLHNPNTSSESKEIILITISNCLSSITHYSELHQWTKETNFILKVLEIKKMVKSKTMQLHLIKFVRVVIEKNYEIEIKKVNFDWLFDIFLKNNKNENALSSSIISLFSFISNKRIHLINSFFNINSNFFYQYKAYFIDLIDKYESINDKLLIDNLVENSVSSKEESVENSIESRNEYEERNDFIQLDDRFEYNEIDDIQYDNDTKFLGKKICSFTSFNDLFIDLNNNLEDDFMD